MRVLHVTSNLAPSYGGPARVCAELPRAQARLGADVTVFSTDADGDGRLDVPLDRTVATDGVAWRWFPVGTPRGFRTSWSMARALRDEIDRFDVVHVHSLYFFPTAVAAHWSRVRRVPYLLRPHGTLAPWIRRRGRAKKWLYEACIERRNLDRAAAIHFTCDEEARLAAPLRLRAPTLIAPNGIDAGRFATLPGRVVFRRRHPALADRRLVVHFGRIGPQ
jgi:glycosyltransferase involved in cell wall biosynthesis